MQQPSKRSSLFLLELILAIAFFSIAAAICVQFFVKSHALEEDSTNLNRAIHIATSAAEEFRHSEIESHEQYYDQNWEKCSQNEAIYTLKLVVNHSKSPQEAQISVSTSNSLLYELKVLKNANLEVSP